MKKKKEIHMKKKKIKVSGIPRLVEISYADFGRLPKDMLVDYALRVTNTWNEMKDYYDKVIGVINGLDDCPYEIVQNDMEDDKFFIHKYDAKIQKQGK